MPADSPPDSAAAPAANRRAALRRLLVWLGLVALAMTAGGWLLSGLDMALAILLGCVLVGFNLLGTAHFVNAVLVERRVGGRLGATLVLKFLVTLAVLYLVITRLGFNPVGLLLGLSSMLWVSLLHLAFRRPQP
ncbi:MAG TPA: ATP synthase subunit I [bacterium]|nr:ATP synthase subunit I [bacterium]